MSVEIIDKNRADRFVVEHHYLHSNPSVAQINYGLIFGNDLEAVASYGPIHVPRSPANWLELRRLVRLPDPYELSIPLSSFLSKTLRFLKKENVPAVLSWADPSANHHGGIYQATNWVYTEPYSYNWNSHFKRPDGSIIDHRAAYKMFGTSAREKVLQINPDWVAFLPQPKYRYLMPLSLSKDECLKILKARERPYPKPNIDGVRKRVDRRNEFKLTGIA